jgi:large subunit ribosomal protein L31e
LAEKEKDVLFERVLTIPMRKVFNRPDIQRAPYAVKYVKDFVAKHTHSAAEDVWIDEAVNELIWERGTKSPPNSLKLRVIKWTDQMVEVGIPEE